MNEHVHKEFIWLFVGMIMASRKDRKDRKDPM